ncbi:hypothetical protein BDW68DRAFT_141459 [Aspergillus falconensis]
MRVVSILQELRLRVHTVSFVGSLTCLLHVIPILFGNPLSNKLGRYNSFNKVRCLQIQFSLVYPVLGLVVVPYEAWQRNRQTIKTIQTGQTTSFSLPGRGPSRRIEPAIRGVYILFWA